MGNRRLVNAAPSINVNSVDDLVGWLGVSFTLMLGLVLSRRSEE
jgi:hypothetical protein